MFTLPELLACPFCRSPIGEQVARGILMDFWSGAALTLAPIPVLAAAVALLHVGLRRLEARSASEE